ncbi:hypothetical protein KAX97_01850 [candidate division WOR-3 bacterium]|nr:hypothetical protein [candidate division WOR-3 bacterium]
MIVRSLLKIAPSAMLGTFAALRPAHLIDFPNRPPAAPATYMQPVYRIAQN